MLPSGQITQADLARLFLQQQQLQQKDALANAQLMSNFISKAQNPQSFSDATSAFAGFTGDKKNQNGMIQEMEVKDVGRRMFSGQDNPFAGSLGLWNTTPGTVLIDNGKDAGKDEEKKQLEMISELADQSAARGDYSQAIGFYNKILELSPNTASAWTSLGHCYSMLNDNFSALKAYQQAMSISDGAERDEQLWCGIGLLYEKIEDYQNAELAFKNGANICASGALKGELCYHLGYILKAKAEYDEAIKVLSTAVLLGKFTNSRSVEILCTIGRCFEEKGNAIEALKMYKHALSLDENNPFTHEFIGWLHFQMDKPTEALAYLQKDNFQETDEEGELIYMIARCYMRLKDYNTAFELFQLCLSKRPYVSFYWSSFGILLCETTQLKLGYEAFNQALKLNPNIPENYYNLGCIFELFGQPLEAINFYDRALSIQPLTVVVEGKNRVLRNIATTQIQGLFKHPVFKLSFLKLQMKEKLDKTYINIRKTDKNAGLSLNPLLLSLILQPQTTAMQSSGLNGMNSLQNSIQNQQLGLQNAIITTQALLQQQQQQALAKQTPLPLGTNDLTQALLASQLGLTGGNSGLENGDSTLNLLQQRAAMNALSMGANYNSQSDILKTLSMSQLGGQIGATQLGGQLGMQLGGSFTNQIGTQQQSSQLNNVQMPSQLDSQLNVQNIGLLNPQLGLNMLAGTPSEQQLLQMQQLSQISQNQQASIRSNSTDQKAHEKDGKPAPTTKEVLHNQKEPASQPTPQQHQQQTSTPAVKQPTKGFAKKQSSQDNKSLEKLHSQPQPHLQPQPFEESKAQAQNFKNFPKTLSNAVSDKDPEPSKQNAHETALAQNEKEKMDTIQEKLQKVVSDKSNINTKPQEVDEKPVSSNIQLKPAKSFQLFKDKGNSDELRADPLKRLKSDFSLRAKSSEETSTSPQITTNDKKDETAETTTTGAAKEQTSTALLVPPKIQTTKMIKPLVLTSPICESKQA